nr:hypothetical protein [uncultured Treponema sp.]
MVASRFGGSLFSIWRLFKRYNETIDWDTLDRLAEDSPDFKKFISDLTEDIALGKVKSKYDEIISDEKFGTYLKNKKIVQ